MKKKFAFLAAAAVAFFAFNASAQATSSLSTNSVPQPKCVKQQCTAEKKECKAV